MARTHSKSAVAAMRALGQMISAGRRERGWTQADLAERLGTTRQTVAQVENGVPTVAQGTVFEAAALTGVPLFESDTPHDDGPTRALLNAGRRLALLPRRIRTPPPDIDDDF